ncbi:MAG: SEC-C metal-binding domain-containing protein [Myxococcota bacterium]
MEQRIDETLAEYALKFSFPRPDLGPKATQRRVDGNPGQEAPKPQSQGGAAPPTPAAAAGASAGPVAGTAAGSAPGDKVGRNDPCPCGSGRKFKKCHG